MHSIRFRPLSHAFVRAPLTSSTIVVIIVHTRQKKDPGKPQEMSIGEGCNDKGIILHELMHALGFWHEQSRTDREKFIEVLWKNVKKGEKARTYDGLVRDSRA